MTVRAPWLSRLALRFYLVGLAQIGVIAAGFGGVILAT